jgi:histidine ammonia-lyase
MIAQYSAASLVSENKVLSHPASVDSIPSSANQEDHVSMGTISARKLKEIVTNTMNVLGIELLCAAQALEFKGKGSLGTGTKIAFDILREDVEKLGNDRIMNLDIDKAYKMIKNNKIVDAIEEEIGAMSI